MRKLGLTVAALLLLCSDGWAQGFIRYYPPSGSGGGMADPGADGIMVRTAADTSSARSITSPAGTIAITNADGVSGNIGLDVDTSIYGQFSSGTATVSGNCTLGDTYLETDTNLWSMCTSTNTWRTAVTFSETATTGMGFVVDEDDMTSNSATKVPTQQSVKAYVDANAGGTFDPGTTFEVYEDFASALTTAGNIGNNGLNFVAIGTGTVAQVSGTLEHPGLFRLNSHDSNDNSGAGVFFGSASGEFLYLGSGTGWQFDAVVIVGSNSTAITESAVYVGLDFVSNADPNASAGGFRIRRDTDLSDTAFVFQLCDSNSNGCGSAGDATNSDTELSTITPSAGTAYRFRIRYQDAGVSGNPTYYFRVNNETEVTFCSSGCSSTAANAPTADTVQPAVFYLERNTTAGVISADVDYMYLKVDGLSRY